MSEDERSESERTAVDGPGDRREDGERTAVDGPGDRRGKDEPTTAGEPDDERVEPTEQDDERDTGDGDGESGRDARRQTLIDAGTAAATLAVVVAVGWAEEVRLQPLPAGVGVLGTLLFEAVTLLDDGLHDRVRAVWERPPVRLGALLLTGVVALVGVEVAPAATVSFLLGALVTYLVLVAAVLVRR